MKSIIIVLSAVILGYIAAVLIGFSIFALFAFVEMIISKIKYFREDKEITLIKTDKGVNMNIELNEEKNTITVDTILNNFIRNIHIGEVKYFSLVIDNAYFIRPFEIAIEIVLFILFNSF